MNIVKLHDGSEEIVSDEELEAAAEIFDNIVARTAPLTSEQIAIAHAYAVGAYADPSSDDVELDDLEQYSETPAEGHGASICPNNDGVWLRAWVHVPARIYDPNHPEYTPPDDFDVAPLDRKEIKS